MQSYLKAGNCTTTDSKRKVFMIRSRNLPIKCNFPSQYSDTKCVAIPCSGPDSQQHIYNCHYLETSNAVMSHDTNDDVEYDDIFTTNTDLQMIVMKKMMNKYTKRTNLLSPTQNSEQTDPGDPGTSPS